MHSMHFLQHESHLNQKKEIVIDTQGKSIDEFNDPVIVDDHYHYHHYLQQPRNINKQSQNTDTLDFEFSLCKGDVWGNLTEPCRRRYNEEKNQNLIWFTGTIDRCSGKVISAAIGRIDC
jgi:hypothetical protein